MESLPDSVKQIIPGMSLANFATLMPDGSPHVVQTWVDRDGDLVVINTIDGSQKHRNAVRDSRVALTITDPKDMFNMAMIRGRVKQVTYEGAEEHIDRMAKKYLGQDKYQRRWPQKRVLIKIEPGRVIPPWTDKSRGRSRIP